MNRRIKQNVYGNWRGYIGRRLVVEFGCDKPGTFCGEWAAREWLASPEAYDLLVAEYRLPNFRHLSFSPETGTILR